MYVSTTTGTTFFNVPTSIINTNISYIDGIIDYVSVIRKEASEDYNMFKACTLIKD